MTLALMTPSRRRTAVNRAAAAAGLLGLAAGIAAPAANAAPSTPKAGQWYGVNTDDPRALTGDFSNADNLWNEDAQGFLIKGGDGTIFYCAQDAQFSPTNPNDRPTVDDYSAPKRYTGAFASTQGGFTAAETPQAAYILGKYGTPKTGTTQQKAIQITAVDIAVSTLGGTQATHHKYPTADRAAVEALVDKYLAEAKQYAGAQTITVNSPASTGKVGQTANISFGTKVGDNTYVPGETLTAKLTGGATFEDGSTSKTFTSGTALTQATIKYTSATPVTINVSATVPDSGIYVTEHDTHQDMFYSGDTVNINGSGKAQAEQDVTQVKPKVTTQTSKQTANEGDEITDTIKGEGFPPNTVVSGKNTLYGPLTEGATSPEGQKVVGTVEWTATTDAKGAFTTVTKPLKVGTAGKYVWHESVNAGKNTDGSVTWEAVVGNFGEASETTIVEIPVKVTKPTLTTQIKTVAGAENTIVSDTVIGKGFPANTAVSGTDDLYYLPYGTAVKLGEVPKEAVKVGSYTWSKTTDAQGNLTVENVGNYKATKPGVYVFVEGANAGQDSTGKIKWDKITNSFGQESETATVTRPVDASVSTAVSDQTADLGQTISDTVIGKGFPAGANVAGTNDLYWVPEGVKTTDGVVPKEAVKVGTYDWKGVAAADGTLKVEGVGLHKVDKKDGKYVYVETLNAGNHNGYTWGKSTAKFGVEAETSTVNKPKPEQPKPEQPKPEQPAPVKPTPKPEQPKVGPKVQTDNVAPSAGNDAMMAALAGGFLAAAAAGSVYVGRHRKQN